MADGCTLGFCVPLFPVVGSFKDVLDQSRLPIRLSFNGYVLLGDIVFKENRECLSPGNVL